MHLQFLHDAPFQLNQTIHVITIANTPWVALMQDIISIGPWSPAATNKKIPCKATSTKNLLLIGHLKTFIMRLFGIMIGRYFPRNGFVGLVT